MIDLKIDTAVKTELQKETIDRLVRLAETISSAANDNPEIVNSIFGSAIVVEAHQINEIITEEKKN